jgi:hypothetical protein
MTTDAALTPKDPKPKPAKPEKVHVVSDNEWVALFVNLFRKIRPTLTNVVCLGKFTDVKHLQKAYTGSITLNPLYVSKAAALAADKESRYWISNVQAVGDDAKNYGALIKECFVRLGQAPGHLLVFTDEPAEAIKLFSLPFEPLIVSPKPVPGFKGSFRLRCRNRDYVYFFNCEGRCNITYDTDLLGSPHHIFSSQDHIEKIFVNFQQSDLHQALVAKESQPRCRCEIIALQYLDTNFKLEEQRKVTVPSNGTPQTPELIDFALKLTPELLVYNPVEMRETSLYNALRNPLFPAAIGYEETVKMYQTVGMDFPDNQESKRRMDKQAEFYRQQTVPMIKPTGDQLLAYYKPGYYTAERDYIITLNGKTVPAFVKGKQYYIYPVQHSEVIELPEAELLEADSKTSRKMTLHCTYTALSMTSELKPAEIQAYNTRDGDNFKVVTAEQYDLARQIQNAVAMGNTAHADELRKRLKSQHGRRLHITSKDPDLAGFLDVFPPPDIKTLSEAYPDKLKGRIQLLARIKAQLTDIQTLHAALASLKRGVVLTHNVGSGKTRIAAYSAIVAGARRVAFIAKSKILGEIIKELRDELGQDVTHIRSASCIRRLQEEIKAEAAARRENKGKNTQPRRTKFYLISQEFLTIGGLANQTFDPYVVDVMETDQSGQEKIHSLICTRENAEREIKEQIIKLREEGVITGNVKRVPFRFHHHVQECPCCMEVTAQKLFNVAKHKRWIQLTPGTRGAIREQTMEYVKRGKVVAGMREFGSFSRHGHCQVCGYLARSYKRVQITPEEVTDEVANLLDALGDEEKSTKQGESEFRSALQFPAYRLLKNIFDTKICDEAHSLTGESKVYEAVKSIHTERTYLLSGTLLRRTPAEMWQIFTLLWGFRAPEFPYAYDQQGEFVEQHVTYRVTRESVHDPKGNRISQRTQKHEMPEPANAPKLWRFLHQAQLHATNKSMGLSIPKVNRHFMAIPLEDKVLEEYENKITELRTSFVEKQAVFSTQQGADWFTRINELQAVALKAKLSQLMPLVHDLVSQGRNLIVACKQQKTFEQLTQQFTEAELDFIRLDEKRPAQPHKRRAWLDANYVQSKTPILLTRTPLINESLNNLVKASAIIVLEPEYVFYPLQQLEGRIARPKQKAEEVDVLYLVTRHPTTTSIDEAMLQMALRRNNANVELVSGNVTQRTNQQLVEMAENQKRRELELMQTLLKEAKPEEVDYQAEFAAREAEIEAAERSKAIIIVGDPIKQELNQPNGAGTAFTQTATPGTTGATAVAAAVNTPNHSVVILASSKENLEMEFGVHRVDGNQRKLRRYKSQLQQAYHDLKSDHTENLTLF